MEIPFGKNVKAFISAEEDLRAEEMKRIQLVFYLAFALILILPVTSITAGSTPPSVPYIKLYEESNSTNWTITIATVSYQDNQLPLSLVNISVRWFVEGTQILDKVIDSMTPGFYYNGICYTDVFGNDYLNPGDYFTLDKTIYANYSVIITFTFAYGHNTLAQLILGQGTSPPSILDYWPIMAAIIVAVVVAAIIIRKRHEILQRLRSPTEGITEQWVSAGGPIEPLIPIILADSSMIFFLISFSAIMLGADPLFGGAIMIVFWGLSFILASISLVTTFSSKDQIRFKKMARIISSAIIVIQFAFIVFWLFLF